MRSTSSFIDRIRGQLILVGVLVLFALLVSALGGRLHRVSLSPEVKFTDASASGLSIVPASCPSTPHFVGDCGSISCTPTGAIGGGCVCPAGYQAITALDGGIACVPSCTSGGTCGGGPSGCSIGYTSSGGQCVFTGCPSGYVLSGTQCITAQCSDSYSCIGDNLYHRDASCRSTFVETCAFGCGGSSCLPPPQPEFVPFDATSPSGPFRGSGHLLAHPTLVVSGDTSQVYWNVTNVSDCDVTGTNGDSWTGPSSGSAGKTTSGIHNRTTYTLTCYYLTARMPIGSGPAPREGSSGGTSSGRGAAAFSEQAVVDITPFFREK